MDVNVQAALGNVRFASEVPLKLNQLGTWIYLYMRLRTGTNSACTCMCGGQESLGDRDTLIILIFVYHWYATS